MVESKDDHSRFIPHKNNAVRFSVDAFVFKGVMDKVSNNSNVYVIFASFAST